MIADRHVLVVGQQRLVGPEHAADVRRVKDRRVEIRVVADRPPAAASTTARPCDTRQRLDLLAGERAAAAVFPQPLADRATAGRPTPRVRARISSFSDDARHALRTTAASPSNSPARCTERQIENRVADGHADARRLRRRARSAEHAERKVLDRESRCRAVGRLTQLRSRGSCVSLTGISSIGCGLRIAGCGLRIQADANVRSRSQQGTAWRPDGLVRPTVHSPQSH